MSKKALAVVCSAGLIASMLVLGAVDASAAVAHREARLTGAKEVPGPGDPNGAGSATIKLNAKDRKVCYKLSFHRIGGPVAAHIHEAPRDEAGDVVVELFTASEPLPGSFTAVKGCVGGVARGEIRDIKEHPGRYYVNIHNARYPDGAIRGQLHR
ncbi:MAG: CHRD domain-containing protein [Actinomycetota bacterium]|nr:CHRD domain-containing protein [Actinomycetota bacterium]